MRLKALALLAVAVPAAAFLPAVPPEALIPRQTILARPVATPAMGVLWSRSVSQRNGLRSCAAQMSTTADEEANKLPAYSKVGQISIKGKAVSVPIGICFIVGSFLWAVVLFPFVLVAYGYSLVFDPLKRRSVDF